uniref:Uncharacterized protein n=1 Tax=Romanomermis culicivorax TaxID=13658 RepID=A0A915HM91_ROMCU
MPVDDWTPCDQGKLCVKGQCVGHADALYHVRPPSQSGGIRLLCDPTISCVKFQGKLIFGEYAKTFTTCEKRSCVSP